MYAKKTHTHKTDNNPRSRSSGVILFRTRTEQTKKKTKRRKSSKFIALRDKNRSLIFMV